MSKIPNPKNVQTLPKTLWRMMTVTEERFFYDAQFMIEDKSSCLSPLEMTQFFTQTDAPMSLKVFANRLCMVSNTPLIFSRPVVMWLSSISVDRQNTVLLAYALIDLTWANKGQTIMMDAISDIMDRMVPMISAYDEAWESQKWGEGRNFLDMSMAYHNKYT